MSENSQRFNLNKIIDDANKSLSVALEPISKEIETNFEIANKLNKFIEDIPIYKILNNKYNDLLTENVALKEKINKFETIFISLSKKNKELDNSNKTLIEKIIENNNNNGVWYENKYFDCRKNSIQLKIIDDKSNDKKDDIQDIYSIYCSNGLSYNNMNVKQSKSDIEEIYDIEETIFKEDEEDEKEEESEEDEEDDEDESEEVEESEESEEDELDDEDEKEEEEEENDKEEDEEEEEDDCQDVFEIIINKKRYYVTDEKNGIIYEIIENDEVGKKIGILKDEIPFFISV
jgi:cobalamin biosynthesis protein CobT